LKRLLTAALLVMLTASTASMAVAAAKTAKTAKSAKNSTKTVKVIKKTRKTAATKTMVKSTKTKVKSTKTTVMPTRTAAVKEKEEVKKAPAETAKETAAVTGTGKAATMPTGETETAESLLVTPEWLKQHLHSVIVVDGRPADLYAHGHIPGAVNAPWTYFANTSAPNGSMKWGTVWAPATMAKRVAALGINGSKPVVCYSDAGDWGQGGWAIWVLRMCGIKNAKLLDGGIYAWKNEKGAITKSYSRNKTVAFHVARYKAGYLIDTKWIKDNLGKSGLAIVDVRTPGEYAGKIRPFKEKRAGHLPGAIGIPIDEFLTKDGKYKPKEEVISMLAAKGITPETEIVVYDTAGVRAAFVTMLLRYAGFGKSLCYDEGFQAWAGDASLPIETTN